MAKKIYYQEHIDYLREISPGRYNDEVTRMFNKKFGMSATQNVIRTLRTRHGIRLGVPRARKQYTDEQIAYLKELSEQGLFNAEITRRFNKKFGTRRTGSAIQQQRIKYGFPTTARYYWPKGHEPWNKGKKGVSYPGMEATQFKKGHKPANWMPIGSERVNADGYVDVKIQDGMKQKNWKGKHIIIWEKHHGCPVPDGHAVIFGDRNNRNFDPENLILVSRAQLARMNQSGLIKNDAALTKTGAIIADVMNKIGEKKRKRKKKRSKIEGVPENN